jgi:crotonobetainyl-CoA:carnitine CoA-transferase CaiB-like acyl-CoA transferase
MTHEGTTGAKVAMVGALDGVRIIDFSRQMSAPYGTATLSDFGADVIKIESVPHGDPSRRTGTAFVDGESGMFLMWNRGKRSVAVDLRSPEMLEIVRTLLDGADVVVENYRPGVADEIGIGYEALRARNPRLIYCSVSAFGPTGPFASYPGTDPVIQAMSGVMSLTGERDGGPVLAGVPIADFTGAMLLVQAVLLGLRARDQTGEGQKIDVSMLAGLMYSLTTRLASYWATGEDGVRCGSAHSVVAPYQAYETADGFAVAGAWAPEAWPRFCVAIDRRDLIDDPRFADNAGRVARRDELNAILDELFRSRTTAEWEDRFHAASALFGEVCTISRILDHPQVAGLVQPVQHTSLGPIPQMGSPITMSATPAAMRLPPPVLGEHTREVLAAAGCTTAQIDELVERGLALVAPAAAPATGAAR